MNEITQYMIELVEVLDKSLRRQRLPRKHTDREVLAALRDNLVQKMEEQDISLLDGFREVTNEKE